jgi:hypothetical protein
MTPGLAHIYKTRMVVIDNLNPPVLYLVVFITTVKSSIAQALVINAITYKAQAKSAAAFVLVRDCHF